MAPSRFEYCAYAAISILLILFIFELQDNLARQMQSVQYQQPPAYETKIVVHHDGSAAMIPRDRLPQPKTEPRPVLIETKGWTRRIEIVPEYKLVFCTIEKVGLRMFKSIMQFLRGKKKAKNQTRQYLEDLLTDPEWTKAVFFRDPATRFLSAFRSKCVAPREEGGTTCKRMFPQVDSLTNFTFDDAIDLVAADPSFVQHINFHNIPHVNHCGGLSNTLPYYDFVDQITENTSVYTIGRLLNRVGVNKTLNNQIIDCLVARKDCTYLKSIWPDFPRFPKINKKDTHITGSNHGNTLLENYKTDQRLQIIQKAYKADYDLFHYQQLSLEELQKASV